MEGTTNRKATLSVTFVSVVIAASFLLMALSPSSKALPDEPTGETAGRPNSTAVLIPGTVAAEPDVVFAVQQAILAGSDVLPKVQYHAITDLQYLDRWLFVSVIGVNGVGPDLDWNLLDNGVWFGSVLLIVSEKGQWIGAVEGSDLFSSLLAEIPATLVSPQAKADLDPRQGAASAPTSAVRFPWPSGTRMLYGTLGLHDNGFAGVVDGWRAVDFLSDGNTGAGHAPNRLLASAAGSISYKCSPSSGQYTTAIRIGDLMYTHLLNSGSLYFGRSVSQGDELGQMMSGSFTENCGYASQGAGWFHVHWGFPNTGSLEAGGWTLSFADQLWRRASENRGVNSWFLAEDGSACSGPALKSPNDDYVHTSSDRTITFGWNGLSGCTLLYVPFVLR
jgi:hypothetical protein